LQSKIKKIALWSDIHFGKKNNLEQHNKDCLDFIEFFCSEVKKDKDITHIAFLGDLFESRSAINVLTLNYAHIGLTKLDSLGLPIIHIIGNHDLYHRTSRKIHSAEVFKNLENFIIISEPTVIDNILFCPYLFKHEYPTLVEYKNIPIWLGHFEFKGFIVTGSFNKMEHGPDHTLFKDQNLIISGHFHKRQIRDNVIYIGNTFPMDFGDAGDLDRGMAILDVEKTNINFINWENCPGYFKTSLKKIINGEWVPRKNSRIRCTLDLDITYNEAQILKEEFLKTYNLREFIIEENIEEKKEALEGDNNIDINISNIDEMVETLLTKVTDTTTISSNTLIEIYKKL
jgi:DNA repair exonuclease SbcCD nuclease subunit